MPRLKALASFVTSRTFVCLLAFLACLYASEHRFLVSFVVTLLFYCAIGGYDTLQIAYLTLPRDLDAIWVVVKMVAWCAIYKRRRATIATVWYSTAKKFPQRIAFRYRDQSWTFEEVDRITNKIANYFLSLDSIRPGDCVSIVMEARPEFVFAWLGLCKANVIASLINCNLTGASLAHCIKASGSKALIVGNELLANVQTIVASGELPRTTSPPLPTTGPQNGGVVHANGIKKVKEQPFLFYAFHNFHCRNDEDGGSSFASPDKTPDNLTFQVQQLENLLTKAFVERPPTNPKFGMTDVLFYLFTSGTTGLPKPAKIKHYRFFFVVYAASRLLRVTENDVVYACLPIYHANNGILAVGEAIFAGATVVIRSKFSASKFWDDCAHYGVTMFCYIGEICRYLLAQPVNPNEKRHKIRMIAGNGMRAEIWEDFQKRFNIPRIGELYGATEGNCSLFNSPGKVGAVGFLSPILMSASPLCLIKVDPVTHQPWRDPDTGFCEMCGPNEPGELIGKIGESPIRSFDGYVQSAESEKKILRNAFSKGDQYFRSGDIVELDRLGFVYFRDRTGDTFRWKGENASTMEVEGVIGKVFKLHDYAVYGVTVPGNEGRAGMAAIRASTDSPTDDFNANSPPASNDENQLDLKLLYDVFMHDLPHYARPVFIRVVSGRLQSTGTFKLVKKPLITEGYDPSTVSESSQGKDKLFYLDPTTRSYQPLTHDIFAQINNQSIRL